MHCARRCRLFEVEMAQEVWGKHDCDSHGNQLGSRGLDRDVVSKAGEKIHQSKLASHIPCHGFARLTQSKERCVSYHVELVIRNLSHFR